MTISNKCILIVSLTKKAKSICYKDINFVSASESTSSLMIVYIELFNLKFKELLKDFIFDLKENIKDWNLLILLMINS